MSLFRLFPTKLPDTDVEKDADRHRAEVLGGRRGLRAGAGPDDPLRDERQRGPAVRGGGSAASPR